VSRKEGKKELSVPADAISVPADSAAAVVKFTISIPRESCTNTKAKYSSSVVPPDPSVHFYHWLSRQTASRGLLVRTVQNGSADRDVV